MTKVMQLRYVLEHAFFQMYAIGDNASIKILTSKLKSLIPVEIGMNVDVIKLQERNKAKHQYKEAALRFKELGIECGSYAVLPIVEQLVEEIKGGY